MVYWMDYVIFCIVALCQKNVPYHAYALQHRAIAFYSTWKIAKVVVIGKKGVSSEAHFLTI